MTPGKQHISEKTKFQTNFLASFTRLAFAIYAAMTS